MDKLDGLLTDILVRVQNARIPDEKKADIYARISAGMRSLVWPILISRMPEQKLAETVAAPQMTMDQYVELVESALKNPETPKDIQDQITGALTEIGEILTKNGIAPAAS
ncbi:hypothetical protein A2Z33_07460 [Candidatus Gottesmanbacteria bacterium RBG_16_52_11]|uniref:Uncharacterized protein n=1 Tax=Candidatus Gottesmanbacteria bacterium RBG_16_52_11 TaxID=1798374 RepID=A0A1F5YNI9_9BACT|nr:MAG: hypothetical protein A2Z33_07460 [Candidatus Gottesmanbacteria bacterium RBG_16_52_11]